MVKINSHLICGHSGSGKTTYATNKWNEHLLIDCDNPLSQFRTYAILEQPVYRATGIHFEQDDILLEEFYNTISKKSGVIIDNVEKINIDILKLIINIVKTLSKELILIFDTKYQELHKSPIFIKLLDWDVIDFNDVKQDFQVEKEDLEKFIYHNYSPISQMDVKRILELTGNNFNNIKKLMWISRTKTDKLGFSENAALEYLKDWLDNELQRISIELIDVLKKSSVIGEIFNCHILEAANGFNILGASNYLDELENEGIFISKYLMSDNLYHFINEDVYNAVFTSVPAKQKNEWKTILKNYYCNIYLSEKFSHERVGVLSKIKEICIYLNDHSMVYVLNHSLLKEYLKIGDTIKAIEVIDELIDSSLDKSQNSFNDYLLTLKLKLLIDEGANKEALEITKKFINDLNFKGGQNYLKYYHIKCLYHCGNVDEAYNEIIKLVSNLKTTAKTGKHNQAIYPLTYSMMASIQNHLGIDDEGYSYYRLALNYAYNKLDNLDIYFDILSKSEMYFDSDNAYKNLKECIEYYEKKNNKFQTARVYCNLATEMMFNENKFGSDILTYLNISKKIFSCIPNENLAYAKNNIAIYYILFNNDIKSAVTELEEALFVGLSDFTYMTIYLNLSMCYFKMFGNRNEKFKESYKKFIYYEKKVENRNNATKYEVMYRMIAQLICNPSQDSTKQRISKCKDILKNNIPDFFRDIVEDIKNRLKVTNKEKKYLSNSHFYKKMNDLGIFLAEFRFWE